MAPAKLADEERALSHSRAFNAMSVPPLTMKGGLHRLRRRVHNSALQLRLLNGSSCRNGRTCPHGSPSS